MVNQLRHNLTNTAIGAAVSILVLALLVGIQLVSQAAVQAVLAMLAGAVATGAVPVARGALFPPSDEPRLIVAVFPIFPVPLQLMFIGMPLLIVSFLADPSASLVSAALLGALLVTIVWSWQSRSWQMGPWQMGSWQSVWSLQRRFFPVGQHVRELTHRHPEGRFKKFSERARRVLSLAQEEAQRFNHNYIGTEHILLGLVRETDGMAGKTLSNLGVELGKVRSAVEFIIGPGERVPSGEIGLTPRSKKVIELAVDEVRRLSHHYIGTEHLLIGLMREGEGVAAGVLESLGVDEERVRGEVAKLTRDGG